MGKTDYGLNVPGKLSPTGWNLPAKMSEEQWVLAGLCLHKIEGAVQWWLGDWWAYGEHVYGSRKALFEEGQPLAAMNYRTLHDYGRVARAVESDERSSLLTWYHHFVVAPLARAEHRKWLTLAVTEGWTANQMKSKIARQAALDRCAQIDLDAAALGKHAVLYVDPPWQYENPPMGGSNRSIENHYPTMTLDEICAFPISHLAHDDSVLFMWATSPKLVECMRVLEAWRMLQRTTLVWVKDKIGMGYYARERHELLLVAKRGELPPPVPDMRPDSVIEAPRLEHSAKPPIVYDMLDSMYPGMRKIEVYARNQVVRPLWTFWGNQQAAEAAE